MAARERERERENSVGLVLILFFAKQMDFEDEDERDLGDEESSSRASSSALSSSIRSAGVSRGRLTMRRRPHLHSSNHSNKFSQSAEDEDFSLEGGGGGSSSKEESASLVVVRRGAGASSWAVQDAGTVQMLKDECSYLCSALVSARSASQALENALELAQLLSSKKSRSVLWQSCARNNTSTTAMMNNMASPLSAAAANSTDTSSQPTASKPSRSKTILDAILDVIACVANSTNTGSNKSRNKTTASMSSSTSSNNHRSFPSSSRSAAAPASPSRSGARTKSARRKLKQQQLLAPQDSQQPLLPLSSSGMMAPSWWSQNNSNSAAGLAQFPELAQTLAIIVYYLSLDCTLSKEYSVAAMGAAPKPSAALTVRNIILQHGRALQGIAQLCLVRDEQKSNIKKGGRLPLSVTSTGISSSSRQRRTLSNGLGKIRGDSQSGNEEAPSSSGLASSISTPSSSMVRNSTVQRKRRRQETTEQSQNMTSLAATSPADSLSSLSFAGDNNLATGITPKASGSGDPTKAGRQNRRRRRLLQAESSMLRRKLPAVPEGDDVDGLDWQGDKIVPPPSKRARQQRNGNSGNTHLSFTSQEASSAAASKESALFPEPLSPARKGTISSRTPLSPDDQSLASSVASVDSAGSFIAVRFTQKIQQLRAKVHLSSLPGDDSSSSLVHKDCDVASQQVDPWVSLVCLESLNRIITGKEGDGTSCLAGEQNDDEASPEDEESNPHLQTNRLLGNSGIIPCLSKCMSQELDWLSTFSGGNICNTCVQYRKERITVLASLIDGACLFNKENRCSFAENQDPFSFEDDPVYNTKTQGLIFHILRFLYDSMPPEMNRPGKSSSEDDTNLTGVRLLALRTLTSLTHDNELAAQQMTACHNFCDQGSSIDFDGDDDEDAESTSSSSVRGINVLAKLIFELETEPIRSNEKASGSATVRNSRGDEELHRYDSTIFCLNTLANIIEASDVRRLLAEITVPTASGDQELWIQWLCKWLVQQTEGFRDAILSIGREEAGSQESERELEKNEEEKLLAAGNSCVLLACLMMEPDEVPEEPESTSIIRKIIVEQMPLDKGGKSTGVTMLINTLKAFCNFYHFSLGELSLAIVGPVKKLIDGLQELK